MRSDPILDAFAALTRRDEPAPLVASPSASASRGEVSALAERVRRDLAGLRLAPGSPVLLVAVNGAGFLAGLVGCRRAGLTPVLCDRAAPEAERARVVRALGAGARVACDVPFPVDADDVRIAATGVDPRAPLAEGYVKLTSGSSGEPRGIPADPATLAADDDQLASTMALSGADRFLAAIPWSHSYGLSSLVLPALRRGSLLILPEDGGPWSPLAAARALGATVMPTVPVYVRAISEIADARAWPASLAMVISAGARLAPEDARRFREVFGLPVRVFYGASECGGIAFDREGGAAERGTVGTPVDGVTVRLEGEDAPREGTLTVSSAAVASEDKVFRTADLASIDAGGEIRLLGRVDALINVDGKKVQPREVEAALSELPGVREVVVLGVRVPGTTKEIVRAVIARDPGRLAYAEVAAWCRARLAPHKVPRSVVLVDAIPRTERGKPDRAALAAVADLPEAR